MRIFIVYANPEPNSLGAAMRDRSVEVLRAEGHEVVVSDLYAMQFDPVARGDDFQERRFPDRLQYDREQKHAVREGAFAPDIRQEIDRLFWCDHLILQFPLWWWSVPAILKGWIDRVFVNGLVYGAGLRLEHGGLKPRSAMLAFTTGCYPEMAGPGGLLGNMEASLWHLHSGTFHYAGLSVLPPFIGWRVRYSDGDPREATLDAYAAHLRAMPEAKPYAFHISSDVGADWTLREDVAPINAAYAREGWRL
ncbi:hypothetical protein A3736_00435 [Erythrobacter sp. HI0063]|jgi:NAD(P)H dehydrogenase (quinone)|uniref:NAD(P)H-dependent oxidoreductase n=1 Tax=Erythrobacter sp. HI0063 TaxID=1822240 RepID=UPI0007C373AC|nr:NAD(P)H-dependent oxidoreductase [Erythrobacter sp. HI0063]KZY57221.1 hypothetical protein A3736_00435 [Erythrobacter sp. HI0063]